MTDIDRRLRGALDSDDEAFLHRLDTEPGLFGQLGDTLSGPLGGWAKLVFAIAALLGIAMLVAVWKMATAANERDLILWSAITIIVLILQGFTKQWLFDRINLNAMLRELKRIELRVARIEDRRGA